MCIVENISKQQFLDLKTNIADLKSDIAEIKDALLGNKYNPNGIMNRVAVLEEDVQILNKKIDNGQEIQLLKEKLDLLEKGTKFWVTISNNRWIAGLIFFAMYMFTIKEFRDLLLKILGIL